MENAYYNFSIVYLMSIDCTSQPRQLVVSHPHCMTFTDGIVISGRFTVIWNATTIDNSNSITAVNVVLSILNSLFIFICFLLW